MLFEVGDMWPILAAVLGLVSLAVKDPLLFRYGSIRSQFPSCAADPVPPEHQLVVLQVPYSASLSDLVFDGDDREADLLSLDIEPGREAVTLVLSMDESTIFDIHDSGRRLARVVVIDREGINVGVTGVERSKVGFVKFDCPYLNPFSGSMAEGEAIQRRKQFGPIFEHLPERVLHPGDPVDNIAIPSGAMVHFDPQGATVVYREGRVSTRRSTYDYAHDGRRPTIETEVIPRSSVDGDVLRLADQHPGGIRSVDARLVISRTAVAPSPRIHRR